MSFLDHICASFQLSHVLASPDASIFSPLIRFLLPSLPSLSYPDLVAHCISPDPQAPLNTPPKRSQLASMAAPTAFALAVALGLSAWGNPLQDGPPQVHGPNLCWALSAAAHLICTCSRRSPSSMSLGDHSKCSNTLLFNLDSLILSR